jgi:hypothetical protein
VRDLPRTWVSISATWPVGGSRVTRSEVPVSTGPSFS